MSKAFEPYGSRLALKEIKPPDKIGMIHIPENTREAKPLEGIVVAIGATCEWVQVGDHVLFAAYSGYNYTFNGEDIRIMNEEDVIGKVVESPA